MSREHYESPDDLRREALVAGALSEVIQSSWSKVNGVLYPFDVVFHRAGKGQDPDEIVAFGEIKCRSAIHDPVWLSLSKWVRLTTFAREVDHVPMMLIFASPGWLHYMDVRGCMDGEHKVVMAGRVVKTRDASDIEPVIELPLDLFIAREWNEKTGEVGERKPMERN